MQDYERSELLFDATISNGIVEEFLTASSEMTILKTESQGEAHR